MGSLYYDTKIKFLDENTKYNKLKDSFKCIVCMDNFIDYIPSCGHNGCCIKCYNKLNDKFKDNCLICKQNCKYNRIFLPFEKDCVISDNLLNESKKVNNDIIKVQMEDISKNKLILDNLIIQKENEEID